LNCNYANSFKRISNTTQQQESHLTKGGGYPRGRVGVTENWVFLQGFLLIKIKCDDTFGGKYEHHLISEGDTYKIRHKKVTLINCDAPQKTLTVYL
jgi:hypothetical protein